MELWSKGLGKRVLSLTLREREAMLEEGDEVVIKGVMHAPVYWDYRLTFSEVEVVEILEMLKKSDSMRFILRSSKRWAILGAGLSSALIFLGRTVRFLLLGAPPLGDVPSAPVDDQAATDEEAAHGEP